MDRDDQPVSWLVLERYALGELDAGEAARVDAHLQRDPRSRACLDLIREQEDRPLPPLDGLVAAPERRADAPEAVASAPEAGASAGADAGSDGRPAPGWIDRIRRVFGWRASWAMVAGAVAAAAVLLLSSGEPGDPGGPAAFPPARVAVKGGEVALALVRDSGGAITHDPTDFAPDDRFKVLATCPPDGPLFTRVVVYQSGRATFPLPALEVACGNRVVLPGAFRITGHAPATVCLAYSRQRAPSRDDLARAPGAAVCAALAPR